MTLQKENQCECGRKNISEGSVEEDGEDTEEDIAIVHADVGNEVRTRRKRNLYPTEFYANLWTCCISAVGVLLADSYFFIFKVLIKVACPCSGFVS